MKKYMVLGGMAAALGGLMAGSAPARADGAKKKAAPPVIACCFPTPGAGFRRVVLQDLPGMVKGATPVHKLVLQADGKAFRISGTSENPVRQSGRFDPAEFQRLAARMDQGGFFGMQERYTQTRHADGTVSATSDGSTTLLQVEAERGTRRVENYARSGPAALREMELLVRGLAQTIRWSAPTPVNSAHARVDGLASGPGITVLRGSAASGSTASGSAAPTGPKIVRPSQP